MSTEDNKALVRRAIEDLNQGNLGEAEKYFTSNFVYHDAANPHVQGGEEYVQFLTNMRAALPGQFTIEDLIAEGDKVVARYTARAVHRGQWRGIPPTGKQVMITGTNTYRFAEGKIAEMWQNADTFSLLQQLGLIPTQG
jgi:steroid delta-isomerase-like uncharacterized protein